MLHLFVSPEVPGIVVDREIKRVRIIALYLSPYIESGCEVIEQITLDGIFLTCLLPASSLYGQKTGKEDTCQHTFQDCRESLYAGGCRYPFSLPIGFVCHNLLFMCFCYFLGNGNPVL